MTLQLFAMLLLGLMCGSELNVAAFAHPTLTRQPLEAHIEVRSSFAALFGRVMPFWMSASALLNLLLLLPFANLNALAWRFAAIALTIQILAVVFSLVAPVPINNRIARWTPRTLPNDWKAQENRWDLYHWLRTGGLVAAFAMLTLSVGADHITRQNAAPVRNTHLAPGSLPFWLVLLVAAGIIAIGARFIVSPSRAATDFGSPVGERENIAYLWAKGTRDIVSGLLVLGLLWLRVRPDVMGTFMIVASLIPLGDLLNVYIHGHGRNRGAIWIHGATALFMWLLAACLLNM